MIRRGIYAGSFDLLTEGHLWMIREGSRLFDELIVGVGNNPAKKTMFTISEREEMVREIVELAGLDNVVTGVFEGYLSEYARKKRVTHILRGIRNSTDFEYERTMRYLNGDFAPDITTICLMPPRELAEVSSSVVKGLIGPKGWERIIMPYVPANVYDRLVNNHESD